MKTTDESLEIPVNRWLFSSNPGSSFWTSAKCPRPCGKHALRHCVYRLFGGEFPTEIEAPSGGRTPCRAKPEMANNLPQRHSGSSKSRLESKLHCPWWGWRKSSRDHGSLQHSEGMKREVWTAETYLFWRTRHSISDFSTARNSARSLLRT